MAHLKPRFRKIVDQGTGKSKKILSGYSGVFYDPTRVPQRKEVTLRTTDQQAASQRLAQLDRQYMAGLYDPWVDGSRKEDVALDEAIKLFLREHRTRESTRGAKRYTLGRFQKHVPPRITLRQISARHVQSFIEDPAYAKSTRYTHFARLKVFFKWAWRRKMIQSLPTDDVVVAVPKRKLPHYLTRAQYALMVETIIDYRPEGKGNFARNGFNWLSDIVRFDVGTGLRLGEIANLRWGEVDLENRVVHVRNVGSFETKTGKERTVPVRGDALAVLRRRHAELAAGPRDFVFTDRDGEPLKKGRISGQFTRFRERAGLPSNISFHTLRHTYATWLAKAGCPPYTLMALMGHSKIETTMIYVHVASLDAADDVERTFGSESSGDGYVERARVRVLSLVREKDPLTGHAAEVNKAA